MTIMTTTHLPPLVEGPHAICVLPMTSMLREAAMVHFMTSSTDSWTVQQHMEWKSAQKKSKIMTNSMNGQKSEEVTSSKHLGATLASTQQTSTSGLPQQWLQ